MEGCRASFTFLPFTLPRRGDSPWVWPCSFTWRASSLIILPLPAGAQRDRNVISGGLQRVAGESPSTDAPGHWKSIQAMCYNQIHISGTQEEAGLPARALGAGLLESVASLSRALV